MKLSLDLIASLESEILKRVRSRPGISRVELARELRIAPSTVGNYVGRLVQEAFLAEAEESSSQPGRPRTLLRLNPERGEFIGVDFEARNIMAMAVDFSDKPLRQAHGNIQESDTVSRIIEKLERAITQVLPRDTSRLLAIGVGVPGLVDPIKGIALQYKYLPRWHNVALAAPLSKRFGVPVHMENNVRSMALAELWFGQGRGVADFLCLGIRSGIGAGIIAGGQLQRGTEHRAGEVGRWRCPWPARPATRFFKSNRAGADTELQEAASVRAVIEALERARKTEKSVLNPQKRPLIFADIVRAAHQRDALTGQVIEVAGLAIGWAVGQLVLAIDPSSVILAGPLTLLGDMLLRPLRSRAEELLKAAGQGVPLIVNSTMGEYSGALGAAALAVHEWKPAQ